jgi:dTDP-4-dehydrorhamnose reductase
MRRRCLLIGARGFLGRQIETSLRQSGIDVLGTTRILRDGDPESWIQYDFVRGPIRDCIRDFHFDLAIIAARLAHANIEAKHSPGTEASPFDHMFGELSRTTQRPVTYISSDAVFSGARGRYIEPDEPDSVEPYGSMQAIAERSISVHVPTHLIVRTSFLFDVEHVRADRRLSLMLQTITSRSPFYADTNVYKSPVRVVDVAREVVERTLSGQTGIVHVPGKRKSVYEFYEASLEPLHLTQFRELLVPRENPKPSDTSLQSVFTRSTA